MTSKEKRLLSIAAAIFVIFAAVQLLPTAKDFLQGYWQRIETLRSDIEKIIKLQARGDFWQQENKRAKQRRDRIYTGLLEGSNRQLVGAGMQRMLRDIAQRAGITIRSMDPPETEISRAQEWMLIVQAIRFDGDSGTLLSFLQALDKHPKKFVVTNLDVRAYGKRVNGTIKITGFSRAPAITKDKANT